MVGAGPEAAGNGFSGVGPTLTIVVAGLPAAGKGFSAVGRGAAGCGPSLGVGVGDATGAGRGEFAGAVGGVVG